MSLIWTDLLRHRRLANCCYQGRFVDRWQRFLVFLLILPIYIVEAGIEVVDDAGNTVRLERPAQRIISLAPHITEILFAISAGERVVGAVEYSDYPQAANSIPRVGGFAHLDLEAIIGLRPDLIVAWESGNPGSQVQKLRALGFVLYLSDPRRMEDIPISMTRLGMLVGTISATKEAVETFRRTHERLRQRYRLRPKVKVFYQLWDQPLMTVNGKHLISDVIRFCGGENIFAGLSTLTPTVTVEAVLSAGPEAIVASGANEKRPEWLDAWRRWPQLTAVSRGNLFFVPPDIMHRHGPRLLRGAERICKMLEQARDSTGSMK